MRCRRRARRRCVRREPLGQLSQAPPRSPLSRDRNRRTRRPRAKTKMETDSQGDATALQVALVRLLVLQESLELLALVLVEDLLHALFALAQHGSVILPHVAQNTPDLLRLPGCQVQFPLQLLEIQRPPGRSIESG